jgi:hypothetical protein
MPRTGRRCSGWLFAIGAAGVAACRTAAPPQPAADRYLVTASPIDVGDGIKLCLAMDPGDRRGLWWWEAGYTGCDSRSTGPDLFHPDDATVAGAAGSTTIGFRLGTHSDTRPFIDVRLVLEDQMLRSLKSGARVAVQSRTTLDVTLRPPK